MSDTSFMDGLGLFDGTSSDPTGGFSYSGDGSGSSDPYGLGSDPYGLGLTSSDPFGTGSMPDMSGLGSGSSLGGLGSGLGGAALIGAIPGLISAFGGLSGYTTSQQGIQQIQQMIGQADPWGTGGGRGAAEGQAMSLMGQGVGQTAGSAFTGMLTQGVLGSEGQAIQQLLSQGAPQAPTSDVSQLPGFQAGLEAVERGGAASGMLGSGNMGASLLQYGGQEYQQAFNNYATEKQLYDQQLQGLGGLWNQGLGIAGNTYNSELSTMGTLAGGTVAPGGNSAQLMGILGSAEAAKNNSIMQGLTGVASAFTAPATTQVSNSGGGGSSGGGGGDSGGGLFGGLISGIASIFA